MITAGDFRKGVTIEVDNNVFIIVDFLHVKPGKGAAFVRTKLKNVMTGAVLERTFNPSEKYALAHIERKEMQYLYEDGGIYYFMDNETYDQLPLNKEQVESALPYLKDNSNVTIKFFKGNAFSVKRRILLSLKWWMQSPAFAEIPLQTSQSRPLWKPDMSARCRCL